MGNLNCLIVFLAIVLIFQHVSFIETRSIKLRSASCRFSDKYFKNFTFYVLNNSFHSESELIKPLTEGLKVRFDLQIRLTNSKKFQSLISYTFDICSMVISYKDTLFKRMFKSLLRISNYMQNCPVPEGYYYINGWHVESSLIPSYLYAGDYRLKAFGFMGKVANKESFILDLSTDASIVDN